jgi:predicted S18 family serine protease
MVSWRVVFGLFPILSKQRLKEANMRTIISGIIWIVIFVAVGVCGHRLGGTLGTIVSYAGWLLAVVSVVSVAKNISYLRQGLKMMEEDPGKYEQLKNQYNRAMRNVERNSANRLLTSKSSRPKKRAVSSEQFSEHVVVRFLVGLFIR